MPSEGFVWPPIVIQRLYPCKGFVKRGRRGVAHRTSGFTKGPPDQRAGIPTRAAFVFSEALVLELPPLPVAHARDLPHRALLPLPILEPRARVAWSRA